MKVRLLALIGILCFSNLSTETLSQETLITGSQKQVVIENFDSGIINLNSYLTQDQEPDYWELNSSITYENSPFSLKLYGNTWKTQNISPLLINTGDVWQVSAYISSQAEIQGIGFMDNLNVLFYSFAGSQEVNINEWEPVYQGSFPQGQWNDYQLPIADDWMAFFDYLPEITDIIYVNDKDASSQGVIYFDNIVDITSDLPHIPEASINYTIGKDYKDSGGSKMVDVQFYSVVIDPDSDEHTYLWNFGDDSTSTEENPTHTFLITDNHPYRVLLQVVDSTNRWGQASCSVDLDPGNTSFPITLNFVGDIMLARKYEYPGGIIPTQGVEAIFEPTLPILGNAADITIANLECPLTTHWENHPTKSIYFKGSPGNVDGLTYAGIDIVTLANNHILDYLYPGLAETRMVLDEHNIQYMGAGKTSYEAYLPTFYSKSGVNFAFLSASDKTGQYNNYQPYLNAGYNKPGFANLKPYYIKKQIEEVSEVADFIVLEWHTGIEYSFDPNDNPDKVQAWLEESNEEENYYPLAFAPGQKDRETSHYAIDQGADLVICHHPHIMQGVELYSGKLIAHSLGDFVFDLDYPETYPTFILNSKVNEMGFYEFTITPVYIDDYIPQRARGDLGLHILEDLAQRSRNLDTYLKIDKDSVTAKVIMDTTSMSKILTEHIADLPMDDPDNFWVSPPHQLKQSGSISTVNSVEPAGLYEFRLGREFIWFGNMEDEGATMWDLNSSSESYCDTVAYQSVRSIQHIRTSGNSSNIVTNFEEKFILPSDTLKYSLCGFIKTRNGANVTIQIRYFESRSAFVALDTENIGTQINGNTPWTFYHTELSVPIGTRFFDIRAYSGVPDADTAFSWFDDISVICWDEWADYNISQSIPTPNDYYFLQVKSSYSSENIVVNYSETGYGDDHFFNADIKVLLEGPYNGTTMNTDLTNKPELITEFPLAQPYYQAPWYYNGNEAVTTIPNNDIVDWVLIEFRDAPNAASALESTIFDQQACFLLKDGTLAGLDGYSPIQFSGPISEQLFVVVRHRNHIDIISSNSLTEDNGIYTYDFTLSIDQAYGGVVGYKSIAPGIFGMAGGDSNANGTINDGDKTIWETSSGNAGYLAEDINLDGQVNNSDKDDIWILNKNTFTSLVPE
ncbi:MAG: CapA family protein [Bacteroidales bacterium]|nr:CapA family protein [Bacteroidales bacterium]MCF8403997.1 CapA family protein [Bacteroidales bacterium]